MAPAEWSKEEVTKLMNLYLSFGSKWTEISHEFTGRFLLSLFLDPKTA